MTRRRRIRPLGSVAGVSAFAGFRFPPEVIMLAVRWYPRFGLSYRDLEELLSGRGVTVDHVTPFRWVQRFTPILIDAADPCRYAVGERWFVDETYVRVRVCGITSTAPSISTARSSMYTCRNAATPSPRAGSSPAPSVTTANPPR